DPGRDDGEALGECQGRLDHEDDRPARAEHGGGLLDHPRPVVGAVVANQDRHPEPLPHPRYRQSFRPAVRPPVQAPAGWRVSTSRRTGPVLRSRVVTATPKMNPPTWAKNATPPPFAPEEKIPKFASINW